MLGCNPRQSFFLLEEGEDGGDRVLICPGLVDYDCCENLFADLNLIIVPITVIP